MITKSKIEWQGIYICLAGHPIYGPFNCNHDAQIAASIYQSSIVSFKIDPSKVTVEKFKKVTNAERKMGTTLSKLRKRSISSRTTRNKRT